MDQEMVGRRGRRQRSECRCLSLGSPALTGAAPLRIMAEIQAAAPGVLVALHHIGSTAVPGLVAKPVIDLLGEVRDLARLDAAWAALEGRGWRWRGENGVAGRRNLTWDDPATGARAVHLHVHAGGDPMIPWHLGFRDRLRAELATAAEALQGWAGGI